MIIKGMNILVLAPHIDDGEFGCGGTLVKYIQAGCKVKYVAFSDCKESLPKGMSSDTLRHELVKATSKLGIDKTNVSILDYKVRYFHRDRQSILQKLIDLKKDFNPDVILTPNTKDIHQDHQVISAESIRAFKDKTILGYELPWNCLTLSSRGLITLEKQHIMAKIEAIKCYKSQVQRPYHNEEYIKSLAITRGRRINVPFAESFEPIRIIL